MNRTRTVAAVASAAVFVYLLYLSQLPFDPLSLLSYATIPLVSAAVVATVATAIFVVMRRKELEPLSGTLRWVGWIPFSAGILLYVLGTYSVYPYFLHWVSLWALLQGMAVLLLGIRSWDIAMPSLSLLIPVAPVLPSQPPGLGLDSLYFFCLLGIAAIALSRSLVSWLRPILSAPFILGLLVFLLPGYVSLEVLAAASVLGVSSLALLRRTWGRPGPSCNLDFSSVNAGRKGCVNCGRPLAVSGISHARSETAILSAIALVSLIAWFMAIPVVTVTSNDVNLTGFGATHVTGLPYIAAPAGFLQNYSAPSPTLEKSYGEQLVVIKHFFPAVRPENFSYTLYIEAAFGHPYLVKYWEYLPGYNRTTVISAANASTPFEIYSTLLRSANGSVVAVSYEIPVTVLTQGVLTRMYIGVNALAYPSFNVTQSKYEVINAKMMDDFVAPQTKLLLGGSWASDIAVSISTVSSAMPFVFPCGGAALVLGAMGIVLNSDKGDRKVLDYVEALGYEDKRILTTAMKLKMHSAPIRGEEFLWKHESKGYPSAAASAFFWRLLYLEKLGLLKQEPFLENGRLRFLWRLAIA